MISVEQRFTLLAKLGENLDWDSLTTEQIQVGIREAHTFAAQSFESLIRNGFRMQTGDFFREVEKLAIQIPALPRPTLAELQKFGIKEIEGDVSPTEAVNLKLGTVLRPDEDQIEGDEYERRRTSLTGQFGYQQSCWLVEHQDESPEFMALLGKVYIDFPGLVVVGADGGRRFPYLNRDGGRWGLSWRWVGYALRRLGRLAVFGK